MARPKQEEMPGIEGPGVSRPKFRDIDKLADRFIEAMDETAGLKTELEELELSIIGKMEEHGISSYRFSDRQITIKSGKQKIKVKSYCPKAASTPFEGGQ